LVTVYRNAAAKGGSSPCSPAATRGSGSEHARLSSLWRETRGPCRDLQGRVVRHRHRRSAGHRRRFRAGAFITPNMLTTTSNAPALNGRGSASPHRNGCRVSRRLHACPLETVGGDNRDPSNKRIRPRRRVRRVRESRRQLSISFAMRPDRAANPQVDRCVEHAVHLVGSKPITQGSFREPEQRARVSRAIHLLPLLAQNPSRMAAGARCLACASMAEGEIPHPIRLLVGSLDRKGQECLARRPRSL
jgi:hypothetical protein